MKRTAMVIALTSSAGLAWAGAANHFEVSVDLTLRRAFGSLSDARRSPDAVQFIGCSVSANAGEAASVYCDAKTAANVRLTCSSSDPEIVKAGQAVTDYGYIYFECEPAPSNTLKRLAANKNSIWLP